MYFMGIPPLLDRFAGISIFTSGLSATIHPTALERNATVRFARPRNHVNGIGDLMIPRRIEISYDREVCIILAASAREKELHENDFP